MVNHRDKKLDSYLGREVMIMWKGENKETVRGLLFWGDDYGSSVKQGMYFLQYENGGGISFRKSHVGAVFPLRRYC